MANSVVAKFTGIIDVPMFGSGIAAEDFTMSSTSYGPMRKQVIDATANSNICLVTGVASDMPCVGGLASIDGGVINAFLDQPQSWFDDAVQAFISVSGSASVAAWSVRKFMQAIPGVYDGSNLWSPAIDTTVQTDKAYITPPLPALWGSEPITIALWPDFNAPPPFLTDAIGATARINNTLLTRFMEFADTGGGIGAPGTKYTNNRMDVSALPWSRGMRNTFYQSAGDFGSTPLIVYWDVIIPGPGGEFVQEVWGFEIDNSFLNNFFQEGDGTAVPSLWNGGFISIINTHGEGPTGQVNECMVFNSDMSEYYLINFVPQDTVSDASINNGYDGWNVSIDNNGIVWFLNAASETPQFFSYSFSPIGFSIPVIQAIDVPPLILPCYNVCSPVDFVG